MVINGKGNQQILYEYFSSIPSEVLVNGEKSDSCKQTCYLKENLSNITLIFNNKISSFAKMFRGCENITYIDFSNFDTSNVNEMQYMFLDCSNLEKINFGNINTTSVENMVSIFKNCHKLTSIDISNFDISKVTDMSYMFYNCVSLTQLDLSNFDISSLNSISYMFKGCKKLEYINLNNSIEINDLNTLNAFELNPINMVICINNNSEQIINSLQIKKCYIIDCSEDWKKNQKKIISGTGVCVNNCNETEKNKYEYNNVMKFVQKELYTIILILDAILEMHLLKTMN